MKLFKFEMTNTTALLFLQIYLKIAQLSGPQRHYSSLSEMFMSSGGAVTLSGSEPARSFHEWMISPYQEIVHLNIVSFQNQLWKTFSLYQVAFIARRQQQNIRKIKTTTSLKLCQYLWITNSQLFISHVELTYWSCLISWFGLGESKKIKVHK